MNNETVMRKVLGVAADADVRAIKAAFRKKIKLLHPDRCKNMDTTIAVGRLMDAYTGLMDSCRQSAQPSKPQEDEYVCQSMADLFAIGEIAIKSQDACERAAAVVALGKSGRRAAFTYIKQTLYDKSPTVVQASVLAVGQLRLRQAAGDLAAVYERGDSIVRLKVLQTCGMTGYVAGYAAIMEVALEDSNPLVKAEAVRLQRHFSNSDSGLSRQRRA